MHIISTNIIVILLLLFLLKTKLVIKVGIYIYVLFFIHNQLRDNDNLPRNFIHHTQELSLIIIAWFYGKLLKNKGKLANEAIYAGRNLAANN